MSKKQSAVMEAATRFTPEVQDELRSIVLAMEGREVFAVGMLNSKGLVENLEILGRGTEGAVPAPFQRRSYAQVLIHNHPSGILFPSDADVVVAAEASAEGFGSYIVDNEVSHVLVVAEPIKPKLIRSLDADEIAAVLDSHGKLSHIMPEFEARLSQVEMAHDVTEIISDGGILVAEAGTGVGKSFAYLIPALAWAIGNSEPVVISTATINLQQQIYKKDFPIVSSLFKKPAKAVVVKGRGNYLCKRRLYAAIEEDALFSDSSMKLREILEWDNGGGSGDKSDLALPDDDPIWSRVCSESDYCLSLHCPYHDKCHVIHIRLEAASAQLIIANHHVLLADLEAKRIREGIINTVLPSYQALVIDEAHALEASATSLFSETFSKRSIQRLLLRLSRHKKRIQVGILASLSKLPDIPSMLIDAARLQLENTESSADAFNAVAATCFLENESSVLVKNLSGLNRTMFLSALQNLEKEIALLVTRLGEISEAIAQELEDEESVIELRITLRSLEEMAALLAQFIKPESEPGSIFWLQVDKKNPKEPIVICSATPLDVAPILSERLFEKIRSCICTSATLTINGSFQWWRSRVGLLERGISETRLLEAGQSKSNRDLKNRLSGQTLERNSIQNPRILQKNYPSPFPYSKNAMLAIDTEATPPDSPEFQAYLNTAVAKLLKASRGRALVLFTSHKALRDTYNAVSPLLEQEGVLALRQGQKDRYSLLRTFVNDISSVLFATESFWEGVDAPGETLSLVIITRLPFRVPTDPIQSSRAAAIDARGGNSFAEMSIPEAVILFKQGFGRLIRHSQDRGVVAVLDVRILKKAYGSLFISSLPRCRLAMGALDSICRDVAEFLDNER
ncbi:MAG TPA: helicase C-terminal domain-containing protein [Rectinema sp.]|jgi:ATP-dependent DNA helicase DinG|nr:helicase C-terminal domain-containing protein [Rectinema sp.]HOO02324.1 helicase C-terminal domain-containing protein [Rectinema sp.]HQG15308.1 helicase C-terminal domain-containing protein [Rectinema sp.]HQH88318.1 helicase C-terminal domain-containing protein [Rectinema sp.]HQJ22607.1 helicase C-terminal domain-containing protein [Rectinema sp.]